MVRRLWTTEQENYLKEIAYGLRPEEIAEMVNTKFGTTFTKKQIRYKCHNDRIKLGRAKTRYRSKLLTPEQYAYFKKINKGRSTQEVASRLNEKYGLDLSPKQIKSLKGNAGITSGVDTTFKKGHVPANKGIKGVFNVGGNETSFKKGHKPYNWREIGSERVDADGYTYVKVQDKGKWNQRWKPKSQMVWEREKGPIPEGQFITYLDGDRSNCDITNLTLVTRRERLEMNRMGLHFDDAELTRTGINIARLSIKTADLKRKKR